MKRISGVLILLATGAAMGQGAQAWDWVLRTAETKYVIYGGGLGDAYAPAPGDTHIAFYVRGAAAREMFATMGPERQTEGAMTYGIGRV